MAITDIFKIEDLKTKHLLSEIVLGGTKREKDFDAKQLERNLPLIKKAFINKPNTKIDYQTDKGSVYYNNIRLSNIEFLGESLLYFKAKNFSVYIHQVSKGAISLSEGKDSCFLNIYSKESNRVFSLSRCLK